MYVYIYNIILCNGPEQDRHETNSCTNLLYLYGVAINSHQTFPTKAHF